MWFRLNVGKQRNADPRWLLPLICRRGKITADQLGRIEIGDRETRFEVDARVAERFAVSAAMPDRKDPAIRIEQAPPEKRTRR
ncbi:MAG: DbpA RNA binding domain-containing protein [Myxococcales bacterium]